MKASQTDIELIHELSNGNVFAFDTIYEKYAEKLYAFSWKYLKSKEEAEELVQSVFLKVWENRNKLKKGTSFKSFLFTIAYNEICNKFRKKKYLSEFVKETMSTESDVSAGTEEEIDYRFALEQIEQILARLPEKQRVIFIKSRFDGKSAKEIAEELGVTPGTVDNYISKAVKFIRSNMQDNHITVVLLFSLYLI